MRVLNRSLFALPLIVFGLLPGDSLASKDGAASPLLFVAPSGARPYIFSEGGKTIGIVADIAHEISALIQRPIEIKMHDFRKARRMVRDGEADAVLPLSLTPERLNQFDISNPLFTIAFTVFARENESRPPEWPNLEGVRVGVFEKGMSKVLAEKWFPKATMVAVRGTGNATRSLQQSAIDAMITARRAGNQAIYQEKISNVAALPVTLLSTPVGIAVSKGNDALYTTLNGAIDTLQARGMITHILGKWERTRVLLFTKQDVWTVAGLTAFGVSASFLIFGFFFFRQKRAAAKSLGKSEQRFRDFAETSSDWFWETDENLRFSYFSGRIGEITGFDPSTYIGKTRAEITPKIRETIQGRRHLDDMENHRPFRDFRYDFAKSDGSRLSVMINGAPVHDEDGRFLGYRGTGSDITEQTLAEESRDDALQKAQAANNAKSEFLATMSHEFRTPLNAILGFSDMLRGRYQVQVQSEKYREYAEAIHGSGEHMLELVNDILDISAIEAGQRPVVKTSIDVTGLIAACVEEIDATAGEKGVSVKIATPDDLPSLYADERSIRQIVLNLLSNAIKFTPYQGTISLSIGVDGPIMKLAVRDTGIGIPAELLPSVVEPFSQSNSNPHTAQEGFGLGLSIVKSLVDALGGDLTIESEVGVGTVVTVALEAPPLDIVPDRAILQSNAD